MNIKRGERYCIFFFISSSKMDVKEQQLTHRKNKTKHVQPSPILEDVDTLKKVTTWGFIA
jgi:hypothetical protein